MSEVPIIKEDVPQQATQQHKKKRIHTLIACGYIGTNYNGSQMQNGKNALTARTIEGEIATALIKLGYCPEDDLKVLDFERSSRTDSKVSAALTIFTFWVNNAETLDEELNQILPSDIRVHGVQRTTPRFDCRVMCTSRRYIYVMPLGMAEFQEKFLQQQKDFSEFVELQKAENSAFLYKPEYMLKSIDFSVKENIVANLNELAKMYTQQTNTYFNFITDAKGLTMNQTQRKYEQFEFCEPIEKNGQKYSVIQIHGTSFNYNQIRKMVAALCLVARGQCPVTWLYRALSGRTEFKTDIPTAPGQYLLLDRPEYRGHEKSDEAKMYGTILAQRPEIIEKAEKFKQLIFEDIFKTEAAIWQKFVESMDDFSKDTNGYDLAKQTVLREIEVGKLLKAQKVSIEVTVDTNK